MAADRVPYASRSIPGVHQRYPSTNVCTMATRTKHCAPESCKLNATFLRLCSISFLIWALLEPFCLVIAPRPETQTAAIRKIKTTHSTNFPFILKSFSARGNCFTLEDYVRYVVSPARNMLIDGNTRGFIAFRNAIRKRSRITTRRRQIFIAIFYAPVVIIHVRIRMFTPFFPPRKQQQDTRAVLF